MVDDSGSCVTAETSFPGWDEGSCVDDFTRGVDFADVFEDIIGDLVFGFICHEVINAYFAGKSNEKCTGTIKQ